MIVTSDLKSYTFQIVNESGLVLYSSPLSYSMDNARRQGIRKLREMQTLAGPNTASSSYPAALMLMRDD